MDRSRPLRVRLDADAFDPEELVRGVVTVVRSRVGRRLRSKVVLPRPAKVRDDGERPAVRATWARSRGGTYIPRATRSKMPPPGWPISGRVGRRGCSVTDPPIVALAMTLAELVLVRRAVCPQAHLHPSNHLGEQAAMLRLRRKESRLRRLILTPLKLLVLAIATAVLAVSAATAAPTKGKPSGSKPCHGKAKVMVVLKGTLANDPIATDTSFQLNVQHTNRWGRAYKAASQPLTINADANTHYVKGDQAATLDALAQNDQVVVKTKMGRCDLLANASSPAALTAKAVVDQTTGG
jgi:hypothetical protein